MLTWQWSRRQSLTPSTKSHRGSLLKEVAVQGVLYQSILNAKLSGRKKSGRKMCTSYRDDRKLENTVKQSRFKHLGELHKQWTEAGVSASRVTTLRHLQEKGYQATSETETSSEQGYKVCLFVTYSIIQDNQKWNVIRSGPLNGQCKK